MGALSLSSYGRVMLTLVEVLAVIVVTANTKFAITAHTPSIIKDGAGGDGEDNDTTYTGIAVVTHRAIDGDDDNICTTQEDVGGGWGVAYVMTATMHP